MLSTVSECNTPVLKDKSLVSNLFQVLTTNKIITCPPFTLLQDKTSVLSNDVKLFFHWAPECSSWLCVSEHQFRSIGISKLLVGVNVSVNGYLLYVCLVTDRQPGQSAPPPLIQCELRSAPDPVTLKRISGFYSKWSDGWMYLPHSFSWERHDAQSPLSEAHHHQLLWIGRCIEDQPRGQHLLLPQNKWGRVLVLQWMCAAFTLHACLHGLLRHFSCSPPLSCENAQTEMRCKRYVRGSYVGLLTLLKYPADGVKTWGQTASTYLYHLQWWQISMHETLLFVQKAVCLVLFCYV